MFAAQECVILDGGIATELEELEIPGYELHDDANWGMWALLNAPEAVVEVHRSYAEVGCDVISTDTWGIQGVMNGESALPEIASGDWMELARQGIRLARRAVADAGREGEVAVAFSLHGDLTDERGLERLELLSRVFEDEPPDLVLLETMSLIRDITMSGVESLVAERLPGLAQLQTLPPRPLRGFRPALGRPGGRPVRPGGAPLRGGGSGCADDQLHPARPRRGDAALAAGLHRPAARRLSEPRLLTRNRAGPSIAVSAAPSTRSSPPSGAAKGRS